MFDCFCPRTFEWEQPTAPPAPAPSENVPLETFPNQQRPAAVTDGPSWGSALETFVAELHVWWVLCGAYLRWYALLISTIEVVLLGLSLLPVQSSWKQRLQWRPLRHIPEYLRINFALIVSVLTIYANLAAIAGVLMDDGAGQPYLLLPYIVLNLLRLTLEFSHQLADLLAGGLSLPNWTYLSEANHWKSLVLLQCCNLAIMIAVYSGVVPRSGASSPSTESMLQVVQAWYRGSGKPTPAEFRRA